ncbi:hypothetical protein [Dongia sp.]|uniref:hypothetical protein n=1 Tax=Dongia sp. TaxID=1977262 RepID=UPI0035AF8F19
MKRAAVMLIYALCTSCVMEQADEFVTASGLDRIKSREQLFERDIRLSLASGDRAYQHLPTQAQACLVNKTIDRASPDLLEAADRFLARQTEANWSAYRAAISRENSTLSTAHLAAMASQCAAPVFRMAGR